jgi:hypothetical protein
VAADLLAAMAGRADRCSRFAPVCGEVAEVGDEVDGAAPEGQCMLLNSPPPKPVFEHSDRFFATFNLGIPDRFHYEQYRLDFAPRLARNQVPGLVAIRLPGDHTASSRPRLPVRRELCCG